MNGDNVIILGQHLSSYNPDVIILGLSSLFFLFKGSSSTFGKLHNKEGNIDRKTEAEKPPRGLQIKHLFGPRLLGLRINDILMRYSPTGFSQVNESMVPEMIDHARSFLRPEKNDHLLDLYCGYVFDVFVTRHV